MSSPFTALDVVLVAVALLSAILAMLRGFTREVLSILSWVIAAVAAVWAYPLMKDRVRELIQPDPLADAVLLGGTFLIVLIAVSLITVRITDLILDSRIGAVDRTLGFLFGLARGVILVIIAFLFFDWLVPERQQPSWVQNARSAPFMSAAGDALLSYLPEDPTELVDYLPESLQSYINGLIGGDDGGSAPARPSTETGGERQSRQIEGQDVWLNPHRGAGSSTT